MGVACPGEFATHAIVLHRPWYGQKDIHRAIFIMIMQNVRNNQPKNMAAAANLDRCRPAAVAQIDSQGCDPELRKTKLGPISDRQVFIGVILIAAIIAAIHIYRASIWYDEAITLLTTSGHAQLDWSLGMQQFKPTANFGKILFDLHNQDVHPPLYFWTLSVWRVLVGESLEAARALSALFILGTLWLLYGIARDLGAPHPWAAVGTYAVSSVGVWYAYDARPYAMATFLIVLTHMRANRKSAWAGACAAAAIATHYFAALCVIPILILYGIARWRRARGWVGVTTSSFVLLSSPLLLLLKSHILARPHQYAGFGYVPKELWALAAGAMQSAMPASWLPGWPVAVCAGLPFAIAGTWYLIKEKEYQIPLLYGLFLGEFILLAALTNKSIVQMPAAYYLGLASPWLALVIGYGLSTVEWAGTVLLVVAILGSLTARPIVRVPNYREIVARMHAECSQCSVVVGAGYVGAVPACVLYESGGMRVFLLDNFTSARDLADSVGRGGRFFYIPSNEPPTSKIEHEFLHSYPFARKDGYFEARSFQAPGTGIIQADLKGSQEISHPKGWRVTPE